MKNFAIKVRHVLFYTDKNLTKSAIEAAGGPSKNWSGYKKFSTKESILEPLIEKSKHNELARIRAIVNENHGNKEPSSDLKLKRLIMVILGWQKDFTRENTIWCYQPTFRTSYFCETLKRKVTSFLAGDVRKILRSKDLSIKKLPPGAKYDELLTLRSRIFMDFLLSASNGQLRLLSELNGDRKRVKEVIADVNHFLETIVKLLHPFRCSLEAVRITQSKIENIQSFMDHGHEETFIPAIDLGKAHEGAEPDSGFPAP